MTVNGTTDASLGAAAPPEQNRLTKYFAAKYPGAEVWLTDFRRAPSGFSSETWYVTLNRRKDGATSSQALVVRWAPTGEGRQFEDYDVGFQYRAMKALAKAGIPVPEMLFLEEDSTILGGTFYGMRKVEGEIISDYPPGAHGAGYLYEASPEMRRKMWWRTLEIISQVNRIDWRRPEFSFLEQPSDGEDSIRRRLAIMRKALDWASKTPIEPIEQALGWLQKNIPPAPKMALCWSDGRPGNIIWRDYEPVVALDWETMHIAPPENDLAWFILVDEVAYKSFGKTRLEGLPSTEETIARYEQLIGRKVEAMHYYFVMQSALLSTLMASSAKAASAKGVAMPKDYASNNPSIPRLRQLLEDVV